MKISKEQFNTAQKTLSKKGLSYSQKNTMLSSIYAQNSEIEKGPVVSPLSSYFMFFQTKSFAVLTMILLVVSGTSYASAQSLPGDLLYSVKINALEPIVLVLQKDSKSKDEYRIILLQKRIDELEKLVKRNGIKKESEIESSKATQKNVKVLEKSAVFTEEGQNIKISNQIEKYNSLVSSDFEIKTSIHKNSDDTVGREIKQTNESGMKEKKAH